MGHEYACMYTTEKEINKESNEGKKDTQDHTQRERENGVCMRIVFGAETSLKTWRVAAEEVKARHAWNDGNAPRGGMHWE